MRAALRWFAGEEAEANVNQRDEIIRARVKLAASLGSLSDCKAGEGEGGCDLGDPWGFEFALFYSGGRIQTFHHFFLMWYSLTWSPRSVIA